MSSSDPIIEIVAKMNYGEHSAAVVDELHLREIVCSFVEYGIDNNRCNVLLISKNEEPKYKEFLVRCGIAVDGFVDSKLAIFVTHDELLRKTNKSSFEAIVERLHNIRKLPETDHRSGLNILSTFAGSLCKQGKYDDCLMIEKCWHELIPKFPMPMTVLHLYEHKIPARVEKDLHRYHNHVVLAVPAF
jgi:hypothetical protein